MKRVFDPKYGTVHEVVVVTYGMKTFVSTQSRCGVPLQIYDGFVSRTDDTPVTCLFCLTGVPGAG